MVQLRPPQPTVFMFVLDVSNSALESGININDLNVFKKIFQFCVCIAGYLPIFCNCLRAQLDRLPGDSRMMIGMMTFNSSLHYYNLKAGLTQPQMMVVSDLDDQFFPSPDGLLINLRESRQVCPHLVKCCSFNVSLCSHRAREHLISKIVVGPVSLQGGGL